MLQFFRNMFKSRIGLAITIGFIALIGLAFAVSDVASTGSIGGLTGDANVAVVGDEKIPANQLSSAATSALERQRQQNPTLSMQAFAEQGGLEEVLDQLLDRRAISWWAQQYGILAGSNLVNSEIRRIPTFAGPDGKFSEAAYQQVLAQRNLTDAMVRSDLADGLMAQQVMVPAAFGARMPAKIAARYAALTRELRTGGVALIPSSAFAPTAAPTQAQLTAYYQANRANYIRPERRVLRFAVFGADALGSVEPTPGEIAARYNRDKAAKYAGRELRSFTQLVVPTRQAAQAIAARGASGLEAAAREAGLETRKVTSVDRTTYQGQSSQGVATAAFTAPEGAIATPARGGLGWFVVRVDDVNLVQARTLEQARAEIEPALREEKRARALAELAAEVEAQIDDGSSLPDVAKSLKLDLQTTKPIVADGRVYGVVGETAPAVLGPALQSAFEMEEGEPQIAPLPGGTTYLVYEAMRITPSAAAPLAEIRDEAAAGWRRQEGSKAAKAAADRILARVARGATLPAAVAAEKVPLPAVDPVKLTRGELAQQPRVPAPLALLFSMAKNSVKRLEAANEAGWYVVNVDTIEPGKIEANDPLLAEAATGLGQLLGREYGDAMRAAIRKEADIERNADAIAAVRRQLTGTGEN